MTSSSLSRLQRTSLPTDSQPLYRVWNYPGSDWTPNPNSTAGRIDCPVRPSEYAVLYTATTALVALQETQLLTHMADQDNWLFHRTRAEAFRITRFRTKAPLVAVSLDEPNASLLGLAQDQISLIDGKRPYRQAALRIRRERPTDVPALYWRSRHREANALVVAIFDDHKENIGLERVDTIPLLDDPVIDSLLRTDSLIVL